MSKLIKLPEILKEWRVLGLVSERESTSIYKISKKDYDGTVINAILRYVCIKGDNYSADEVAYIKEETDFINTLIRVSDYTNYIETAYEDNPAKKSVELYIVTEELMPLSDKFRNLVFNEAEIIDFGTQMNEILESLEKNNIFHGNICPENIFVTSDGRFKIGGFSDFESKVCDLSFVSPEINSNKAPDFTTDIYSIGLIMYAMCNDGKIPFESDTVSTSEAIEMRMNGKVVPAPKHGSDKLKSVIVIACQSENSNRWKSASNMKNALSSIRNEIMPDKKADTNINISEPTQFDGNLFEEYDYNEFEETVALSEESNHKESPDLNPESKEEAAVIAASAADNAFEDIVSNSLEKTDDSAINNTFSDEVSPETDTIIFSSSGDNEIDERVFDEFVAEKNTGDFRKTVEEKDYGDYFDEEPTVRNSASLNNARTYDDNDFSEGNEFEPEKKSKKNAIIAAVCIVAIVGALAFITFCIASSIFSTTNSNKQEQTTQPITTQAVQPATKASVQPTTVAPTTIQETTSAQPSTSYEEPTVTGNQEVIPVVGYGYSYARKLLTQRGFIVEVGEYEYSTEWPEGYVIAQTPSGNTTAQAGTVVTLDISLGLIESENKSETQSVSTNKNNSSNSASSDSSVTNNKKTDSSYLFANSNSTEISKSKIKNMSDSDLQLAINEIYARRGWIFSSASVSSYFNSKTWYTPKYKPDEFFDHVTFNTYESTNLYNLRLEQKNRR